MEQEYAARQYVGIDLHRRRSVFVRMSEQGDRLGMARVENGALAFAEQIALAGESPEVVLESTYGWYWAVDLLQEAGATVHMAHPLGIKGFAYRRVKNDERDAADLADLLRMGRLPESWIAPPQTRELRELVRHRARLVAWRTALKSAVHGVLAKNGVAVPLSDLFGVKGTAMLDALRLPAVYQARITSCRRLIEAVDFEVEAFTKMSQAKLVTHTGWKAIQALPGIGPILATVLVAEIGDISRFNHPGQLCSWAGLTPRHRESDTKVHRGRITKQGNRLVRWACVEAVQRIGSGPLTVMRARLNDRRGRPIAKVACARKLLTFVYFGLRDGHIRALQPNQAL